MRPEATLVLMCPKTERWRAARAAAAVITAVLVCAASPAIARAQPRPNAPPPNAPPPNATPPDALSLGALIGIALDRAPAVRAALYAQSGAAAARLSADAAFDPVLTSTVENDASRDATLDTRTPFATSQLLTYTVGVQKRLSSGLILSPALSVGRTGGSVVPTAPPNRAAVSLGLAMPLLQGRAGGLVTASATAAGIAVQASGHDVAHARAQAVLDVMQSYWAYATARRQLDVLRESEARAERLVVETEALVRADERAPADLDQLRTNVASKRATRIGSEQSVVEAQQALVLATGLPPEALARIAPPLLDGLLPSDSLPAGASGERQDVRAAAVRVQAATLLADVSRREQRPGLDLSVVAGYHGIDMGSDFGRLVSPLYRNIGGLSTTIGLTYRAPLNNSASVGRAAAAAADLASAELALGEAERSARTGTAVAASALASGRAQLASATAAVALARTALDHEKLRFQLGTATQFDIIYAEDALTSARLAELGAEQRVGTALVRLRYERGTLVTLDDDGRTRVSIPGLSTSTPNVPTLPAERK